MTRRIVEKRDFGTGAAKAASGIYLVTFMLYLCPVLLSGIGYILWECYKHESEMPTQVAVQPGGDAGQDGEIALQNKKIEEYSKEIGELKTELKQLKEKEATLQAMLEQKPVIETPAAPSPTPTPKKEPPKKEPVAEKPPIVKKPEANEKETPKPEKSGREPKNPSKNETRPGLNLALTIQKEGFESLSKDNTTLQLPY